MEDVIDKPEQPVKNYKNLKLKIVNIVCWREKVARESDLDVNFVLHKNFLEKLIRKSTSQDLNSEIIWKYIKDFK